MAILNILQYPDPRLKRVAIDVAEITDEVRQVIADMFETHYAAQNCAALAATQLDLPTPWRITVIDFSPEKNQPLCLINPYIIEKSGDQFEEEGCMSVCPDFLHAKVKRANKIKVKALNEQGEPFELEAEGFMAKCIQHEVDHLDGYIYLDRLPKLKRQLLVQKLKKHQGK